MEKNCKNCKHYSKSVTAEPCLTCVGADDYYSEFEPKPAKKVKKHVEPQYGKITITLQEMYDEEKGTGCEVSFDGNVKDTNHKAKMFYALASALEEHENEAWAKAMFASIMKDMIDKEI